MEANIAKYENKFNFKAPNFMVPVNAMVINDRMDEPVEEKMDHKADPIKSMDDIMTIKEYLYNRDRYRDMLLFIMGINFGLRISDLLKLRVGDIINSDMQYRIPVLVREKKTGKPRKLYVNAAVDEAFRLYIESVGHIDLNEYLFNGYKGTHMTRQNVDHMFRGIMKDLGMPYNAGTHMFRKTYAWWVLRTAKDKTRALYYLQKDLNHSSSTVTLYYAGITDDEIMGTAYNLNLGYGSAFCVDPMVIYDNV